MLLNDFSDAGKSPVWAVALAQSLSELSANDARLIDNGYEPVGRWSHESEVATAIDDTIGETMRRFKPAKKAN